jgi:hypothetical protein
MAESPDKSDFALSREYKFKEFLRYTRTRPYTCQSLMKNFWQCFDFTHFEKGNDEESAKASCLEKFNFQQCLEENKEKLWENWQFNVTEVEPEEGDAE